jgi:hypothetical protein
MSAFKGGIINAPVILTPEVGSASSTSGGYVGLKRTAPLMTLTDANDNSDLQPCVAKYMSVGINADRITGENPGGRIGLALRVYSEDRPDLPSSTAIFTRVARTSLTEHIRAADFTTLVQPSSASSIGASGVVARTVFDFSSGTAPTVTGAVTGIDVACIPRNGGGTISLIRGVVSQPLHHLFGQEVFTPFSGTVTNLRGVEVSLAQGSNLCTVGTSAGVYVIGPPASRVNTTASYGVYIGDIPLGGAPNGAALRIDGQSDSRGLWFASNLASARAGIAFGSPADTTLYRGASGILESPGDIRFDHPRCLQAPTIATGAGAGTSPTIAIAGTDLGFTVTLTQGNPTGTGVICTVTFGKTWTVAPKAGISPGNAATAALSGNSVPYVTTTATTLVLNSGSTGLVAGTQYIWHFVTGPAN